MRPPRHTCPPSLRVGRRRAPPRRGECPRPPPGARPSHRGRRISSRLRLRPRWRPPRRVESSIAVLWISNAAAGPCCRYTRSARFTYAGMVSAMRRSTTSESVCSTSSMPADPRARNAPCRATDTRGPLRAAIELSPERHRLVGPSNPTCGEPPLKLSSAAILPHISTRSGPGESGSRSSSARSSAARMRSAPPSWKYVLPTSPQPCGASRGAGRVELDRGSFGMVPRILESPVRLRHLRQLQEREAVLFGAGGQHLESLAIAYGRRRRRRAPHRIALRDRAARSLSSGSRDAPDAFPRAIASVV